MAIFEKYFIWHIIYPNSDGSIDCAAATIKTGKAQKPKRAESAAGKSRTEGDQR